MVLWSHLEAGGEADAVTVQVVRVGIQRVVAEADPPHPHRAGRHNEEGDAGKVLLLGRLAGLGVAGTVPGQAPQGVAGRDVGCWLDHVDVYL